MSDLDRQASGIDFEDEEDDDESPDSELVLTFTAEGGAVLEENGEPVWMSDDDDDFAETFGDEFLDSDHDTQRVLNYLEEEGHLDEDEKADVIVEQETDGDGEQE